VFLTLKQKNKVAKYRKYNGNAKRKNTRLKVKRFNRGAEHTPLSVVASPPAVFAGGG
jgi:hypothetical protein